MLSEISKPTSGSRRVLVCAALSIALLGTVAVWWSMRGVERPVPAIAVASHASPATCAECHATKVEQFLAAPHAQTLRRLDEPRWQALFANRPLDKEPLAGTLRYETGAGKLWLTSPQYPQRLEVQWLFGSGRHAMTPVSVWTNPRGETELLEHRLFWFPDSTLAPGLDEQSPKHGLAVLGNWHSPAATRHCFGCHSTHVPHDRGQIQFAQLSANVQCERCHQGSAAHAAAMQDGAAQSGLVSWRTLRCRESINRCGECHRRADELSAAELVPENKQLVRFAPVGLAMSRCFQSAAERQAGERTAMTCMTCHDPHRAAEASPDRYRQRCLKCHAPDRGLAKPCSVQSPASQCLACHMPKVAVSERLSFTDHWIRVRGEADPKPRSTPR